MKSSRHTLSLLLLSLLSTLGVVAQRYGVTATVIDPQGDPESYCTWQVFSIPDTIRPITGAVADDNGVISATVPKPGQYMLRVIAPMRIPVTMTFDITNDLPFVNLGIINTQSSTEELNTITVTAQRPLVTKEIDRIGYDVTADADASTSNLREILRKVPMVTVDDDGTIKVNGSTDFKIYKNGRPNNAYSRNAKDIFAAIPASTIKKIEVITDPGAREDAEGSSVILNIVTNSTTSMSGFNASIGLGYETASERPNANAYFLTQYKKLTFSASGGYYGYAGKNGRGWGTEETTYDTTGDSYKNEFSYQAKGHGGYFDAEGSLELDTLNLITTSINGYIGKNSNDMSSHYELFGHDGQMKTAWDNFSYYPKNGYTNIDFALDYQHLTRRKGETLTVSYRLSHTNDDQQQVTEYSNMVNAPMSYTGINAFYDQRFFEHTFQFDWSRPYGEHHKLDLGAKYILRESHSENTQELVGFTTTETEFLHRYHIAGIYADYRTTYGKFTGRAGLRYEYSRLGAEFIKGEGKDFHSNLNDFVPNASLAYNFSQSTSLKTSYSRRIQRPGISYLNPAVTISPTTVSYGNPDLESTGLNTVNLNFSYMKAKFYTDINANYTWSNNGTGGIQWTDPDNISYSTYGNVMVNRQVSFSGFFQWSITSKTQWMLNAFTSRNYYRLPAEDKSLARWGGNLYTRVSQKLPWELNLSLGAYWFSGGCWSLYSYYKAGNSGLGYNLTLKRSFLADKSLDVMISARNIGITHPEGRSYSVNSGYYGISTQCRENAASFSIGINYRFGKLRAMVKKTNTTINNDDLQGGSSRSGNGGGQGSK